MSNSIHVEPFRFVPVTRDLAEEHANASYGFLVRDEYTSGSHTGYESAEELHEALRPENVLNAVFDDAGWDTMATWDGVTIDGIPLTPDEYRLARHGRYCDGGDALECASCEPDEGTAGGPNEEGRPHE